MTTLLVSSGLVLIVGFTIWLAMRYARKQGAAEQRAKDIAGALDAEEQIHEIQAEHRDTAETRRRLGDGGF